MEAVKNHLQPKINPIFARFIFHSIIQKKQSFKDFLKKLRLLILDCNITEEDEMICDRTVFGVNSQKIWEKHNNESENLSLDKAVQKYPSFEYAEILLQEMNISVVPTAVNVVHLKHPNQAHGPQDDI